MKKKVIIGGLIVLLIALIVTLPFFFGQSTDKIDALFNDTISALDTDRDLSSLFLENTRQYADTLSENTAELNEFYEGKSVEINDYCVYHETDDIYRAYATVKTDKDEYFVCMSATGGRPIDTVGIKQLIVEKYSTFKGKKIIKNKILKDYTKQARVIGITIRTPGDHGKYDKINKMINEAMSGK